MAKLYFRYSTMNAGKSLQLLSVAYNYEENNEKILLFTSSKDDRYKKGMIVSRTGLKKESISIDNNTDIFEIVKNEKDVKAILVDESQFLNKKHIFQLSDIVDILNIPVICYGLRSDFKLNPFEGSKYLMTIADSIEEIKTICSVCKNKKANINVRINNDGNIIKDGEQVQIGGNESYKPMCRKCYKNIINSNV
jgi:thymidine kinase